MEHYKLQNLSNIGKKIKVQFVAILCIGSIVVQAESVIVTGCVFRRLLLQTKCN